MRKRLDNIFSALMLAAAVAVVLAGGFCLYHSIKQAGAAAPMPVAEAHLELPRSAPEPVRESFPEPTPIPYNPAVPLSPDLQATLEEACEEAGVPVALALGVIEVESRFQEDADNGLCYGLMQLSRAYFPDKLTPEENIRYGVHYLGELLGRYEDVGAALTSYSAGHDTGARGYANAVLAAAEYWESAKARSLPPSGG